MWAIAAICFNSLKKKAQTGNPFYAMAFFKALSGLILSVKNQAAKADFWGQNSGWFTAEGGKLSTFQAFDYNNSEKPIPNFNVPT